MVLYQQSQPLFRWIHGWTFGDDPRPQNSLQLQAEIVVEMRGIVLMNDKTGAHITFLHSIELRKGIFD